MTKEFKVLNLTISPDNLTGIENLLAVLSEIEDLELNNLPFVPQFFNSEGTYFVFAADSDKAKYLMDNPQDRKFFDMSSFIEHTLNIDGQMYKAYYDVSLVMLQNKIMRDDFEADGFLA